jgi:hypothetical protein
MLHTKFFLLLGISTIALHAADQVPLANFLSKEPVVAVLEIKVIDLMLLRAVQKWSMYEVGQGMKKGMYEVEQGIEKELYSYEQEDLNDYGDSCGATQIEYISCLFFGREKFAFVDNGKDDQNKDYLLLKSIFKTDGIGKPPFYVKPLASGIEEMRTDAVLVAKAPQSCYIRSLKLNMLEDFSEWNENPSIFVQVLIDKHNDAAQHRVNKDYLLERLRAVGCNESNIKEKQ